MSSIFHLFPKKKNGYLLCPTISKNKSMDSGFVRFSLNLQYFIYLLFIRQLYCQCSAVSQTPGERFVGVVVAVVDTVGPQQCVKECLKRPHLCKVVNYKRTHLLCEMMSEVEKSEFSADYIRIEIPQVRVATLIDLRKHELSCACSNFSPLKTELPSLISFITVVWCSWLFPLYSFLC